MKKPIAILLLILGMTISFVSIGLVVLFATGAVHSMDDVVFLFSGQVPGSRVGAEQAQELTETREAVRLLQQQKEGLQMDIGQLTETRQALQQVQVALLEGVDTLQKQSAFSDVDRDRLREKRNLKIAEIFNEIKAANGAAIMDHLSDKMVVEILMSLENDQAAKILSVMADDQRKADLISKVMKGEI